MEENKGNFKIRSSGFHWDDASLVLIIFISFLLFYNFGENTYDLYDIIYNILLKSVG